MSQRGQWPWQTVATALFRHSGTVRTIDWSQWLADEENLADAGPAGQKPNSTDADVVQASADVTARLEPLSRRGSGGSTRARTGRVAGSLGHGAATMACTGGGRQ